MNFLSEIPEEILFIFLFGFFAVIIYLVNNGFSLKAKNFSFNIFKKSRGYDQALIIEKIIEIAFEITELRREGKLKQQMEYAEEKIGEIIEAWTKNYRYLLDHKLNRRDEYGFSYDLEDDADFIGFKMALIVVNEKWKDNFRKTFKMLFINNELYTDTEVQANADSFVKNSMRMASAILDEYYKDSVAGHKRIIKRLEINLRTQDEDEKARYLLKNIYLNAINIDIAINKEIENKKDELKKFIDAKS